MMAWCSWTLALNPITHRPRKIPEKQIFFLLDLLTPWWYRC